MIQRIQSVYLLLATFLSVGLIFIVNLWTTIAGDKFFVLNAFSSSNFLVKSIAVLFFVSGLLSFITIFLFKNRKLQFVMGRIIILINFILLGILVYFSQNLSGEIKISEKGIGLLIPIITIIVITLANKAIKKDEDLVKSVDRLR
jgi:hypothetical protein